MTPTAFQAWTKTQDRKSGWEKLTTIQLVAHLFEEAGELARSVNRTYEYRGDVQQEHEENIKVEITDVLWFVMKIANRFGVDVDQEVSSFMKRADTWPDERHSSKLEYALESLKEELR